MEQQKRVLTVLDLLFMLLSAVPGALIIQYGPALGLLEKILAIAGGALFFQLVVVNGIVLVTRRR